jgi:hypothetical protein
MNGTPLPDPLPIGWGEGILFIVALPSVKRGDNVCKEIGRDADVGVADDEDVVFCEAFELDEFGDFGVRAGQWTANDELGIFGREFHEEFADDVADGVVGRGNAEKTLEWTVVVLSEPCAQGGFGGGIGAFKGFEQCDCGRKRTFSDALMKRKTDGDDPLPKQQDKAEKRERTQNGVQDHYL